MPLQGLTAQHRGGWVSKRLEPHRNQGSNKGKDKLCRMDTKGEDKLSRMLRKLFTEGPVDALRLHPCRGPLFRGWVDALRFTSCGLSQVEGSGFSHKRYRKRLSGSRSFHDFLLQVAALPTTLPSRPCGCCPAGAFFLVEIDVLIALTPPLRGFSSLRSFATRRFPSGRDETCSSAAPLPCGCLP